MKKNTFDKYLAKQIKEDPQLRSDLDILGKAIDVSIQIHELRERRGLTQAKLAKLVGTKQSNVARLENADYTGHSLKTLEKIAKVLNAELEVNFKTKKPSLKLSINCQASSSVSLNSVETPNSPYIHASIESNDYESRFHYA